MKHVTALLLLGALTSCSARPVSPFVPPSAKRITYSESDALGDTAVFILPSTVSSEKFIQFVREETRRGGWLQDRRALTNPEETNSLYAGWIGRMWEGTWRHPTRGLLDVIIVPVNKDRFPGVPDAEIENAMEIHVLVAPTSFAQRAFAHAGKRW